MSILWGKGMEPLTRHILEKKAPEDVKKACLGEEGRRGALFFNPEGYIQSFDCILCVQSIEEHQAVQDEIAQRRKLIEDGNAGVQGLEGELQELLARAGRKGEDPVLTGEIKTAAQHAHVSKELRSNVKIG
jgi:hypothetical protein